MAPFGCVWDNLAPPLGPTLLCLAPFGSVMLCLTLYSYPFGSFGYIWTRLVPFGPVRLHLALFDHVWHRLVQFGPVGPVLPHLSLFNPIQPHLALFDPI